MWQALTMLLRTQMPRWNGTQCVCVNPVGSNLLAYVFHALKIVPFVGLACMWTKNTATLFQVWCNVFMIALYLVCGICYRVCIQRLFCKQKRVLQFGSKLTLNNYLSVIFRDSCDLYVEPLILTQGFTSLR